MAFHTEALTSDIPSMQQDWISTICVNTVRTPIMVRVKAGEILAQQGINAMVINMATVKPLDEELVLAAAKKCGKIITCEEHSVIGGLGEAVCSLLVETAHPCQTHRRQ